MGQYRPGRNVSPYCRRADADRPGRERSPRDGCRRSCGSVRPRCRFSPMPATSDLVSIHRRFEWPLWFSRPATALRCTRLANATNSGGTWWRRVATYTGAALGDTSTPGRSIPGRRVTQPGPRLSTGRRLALSQYVARGRPVMPATAPGPSAPQPRRLSLARGQVAHCRPARWRVSWTPHRSRHDHHRRRSARNPGTVVAPPG